MQIYPGAPGFNPGRPRNALGRGTKTQIDRKNPDVPVC